MPRKKNPVGIAAGRLILAIRREQEGCASFATQQVLDRAHTLLQASQSASVLSLLDGRSVAEYLDVEWTRMHPSVEPSIAALVSELDANER